MFRSSVPRMFTTIANTRYLLLPAGFNDSGIGFVNERRLCFHSAVILPPRVSPYDSLYICLHVITSTTYWFSIGHSCRFILTLSRRILLKYKRLRHESVFVSLMGSWFVVRRWGLFGEHRLYLRRSATLISGPPVVFAFACSNSYWCCYYC